MLTYGTVGFVVSSGEKKSKWSLNKRIGFQYDNKGREIFNANDSKTIMLFIILDRNKYLVRGNLGRGKHEVFSLAQ